MKTILTRIIPLLLSILVGFAVSWVAFYGYWFGVWTFHTVPAARTFDALGSFVLLPARCLFKILGGALSGDQNPIFFDPTAYSGTNGLILGLLLYCGFRLALKRREDRQAVRMMNGHREAEKPASRIG